ncbi:hypothetical protein A3H80_03735 [Candidatus Roizmanbacteria bacterium RIFCSPLOWO2_02_FULL_37_19]|uniref:Type II secretion system protein GspH n=1 Tax=Candidatus Roizmanbacteria bacterium RIFCSPHIGHO2_02_FULL_37_24 TaxID=1802037 RepID=A0A1F7GV50_9BACT|nr:MAG: hypothetical protein A2862_01825 [Candidatus Roizmanbacteria bacterium RIFCSPHIGHO2_01_FULL_38_41]OGK22919.1 MAG: hypothetical protein A3C24_03605 [Candidatus Roizmanbacteria bacterium RIFCSPHIGHO2_02_FULL_37_24]OGK33627.1 MAG: hypothetical protein A3E10_05180 [Candidatus Roizmanbacteria bacterium RIFCSPHIGHO2_12_FULL_37_23]OGK44976.1 MAG: hypothetical protein A2956_00330 [Candidatus Roizmanbacteria bacterium RIFCSPLOWO2_01_FULL_37_57]OGK55279.1 MAG: hypothetical protein A3H80_03735 [Ca
MKSKLRGFTLIETMIVLSIIGLIIPVMFSLFFINLRSQTKVLILQEVKRNGDNSLNTIESLSKQFGVSFHQASPPLRTNEVCVTTGSNYSAGNIYILDESGDWFSFYLDNGRIASESGTTGVTYLTNDKVVVSSFSLTCDRPISVSPPIMSISFTVSQVGTPGRQEEEASLNYQTKIKLRSY